TDESALDKEASRGDAAGAVESRPVGEVSEQVNDAARSLAEWVTLTLSTLVLLIIVGLVLYDWQLSKNIPPSFQVEITETTRLTEGRYYVPFTLKNTGGQIARTVQVVAELHLPDGNDETGQQEFDFLSGNERKKGEFVFEHNPQSGELVVRVASFGLP
ncbi:MAG: TIGR02588 family protein, partial [Cyanobacteria bacterium J06621_11]